MDGPRDCQTKWSKSEKNIIQYHFYVESNKNAAKELVYKTETNTDFKIKFMATKAETMRGDY